MIKTFPYDSGALRVEVLEVNPTYATLEGN